VKPTAEQQQALDAFSSGGSLKIIAGAGTGKTTTLKLLSSSTSRSGVYLAFNKAMADDAKKRMPGTVAVSTAHSLAFRGTKGAYARKVGSRITARQAAEIAGVKSGVTLASPRGPVDLYGTSVGYFLLDWVRAFCNSDRDTLDTDNLSYSRPLAWLGVDPNEATADDFRAARTLVEPLAPNAQRLWDAMADVRNDAPATHDVYLKKWVMSRPLLPADFVLFDEAQDANPLMLQLVAAQPAQRVYVGDPNQQIYAWRGACNAMESVPAERTTTLSESFRFGPQIAEFANLVLSNYCRSPLRLTGRGYWDGHDDGPDATICRTNAGVIAVLADLPVSDTHIAGGTDQAVGLLRGMQDLRSTGKTVQSDLAHFANWDEFVEHVKESKDELATLLKLSKAGGEIEPLIALLSRTQQKPDRARFVLSTGHKCKGLEWGRVSLSSDFVAPNSDGDFTAALRGERANLLYVAGTRAKHTLLLPSAASQVLSCKDVYDDREGAAKGNPEPVQSALMARLLQRKGKAAKPEQIGLLAA
jgi:hypothetical protein